MCKIAEMKCKNVAQDLRSLRLAQGNVLHALAAPKRLPELSHCCSVSCQHQCRRFSTCCTHRDVLPGFRGRSHLSHPYAHDGTKEWQEYHLCSPLDHWSTRKRRIFVRGTHRDVQALLPFQAAHAEVLAVCDCSLLMGGLYCRSLELIT